MAAKTPRLTPEQERFVDEYLVDLNGTAAYTRAVPGTKRSTAAEQASRLLRRLQVAAALKRARRGLARRAGIRAADVIRELARIAFVDIGSIFDLAADGPVLRPPRAIPVDTRRAIKGAKIKRRRLRSRRGTDVIEEVEEVEYRFCDKVAALDKLCRHLGLYKDLPPLAAVLALLPPDLAGEIRRRLAGPALPHGQPAGTP
jgi:phage terminase small subunit